MGFARVVLNSYTFSHNQYDLIFMQESHLSSDSTFRIPGYKTLQKNRFMTRRGTTNSTGNLGGGVLILVKNGLSYTSLSTQSLSSLDPSSDYLAIAVKIKGAAPIHLFNVYVPPIRSSSSDSRPKSFSPFLPSSPTTYIFGDFNSHHSSWDSHSPEDHSGKDLFDWLLSSDLLPLNNPEHHTLLHCATGNRSSPDLSLVPARLASKCTWQTLPDLGSDHLPISITIPTSPIINSFHRPPSFNYNKARWDEYLTYIDTHPGNNVKLARYCIGILLRYMHVLAQYCVIIVCTQYGYWPSIVYTVYLISRRYSADTMLQYRLYIGRMLFAHSMDIGAVSYTMPLISSQYSADTMPQYRLYIDLMSFTHSVDIDAVSYVRCI